MYNYTIVLNHKEKIILPYTNIVVYGKVFLWVLTPISVLVFGLLYYILDSFVDSVTSVSMALALATTFMVLVLKLVQQKNVETNNFVIVDKIRVFYFKRRGYKEVVLSDKTSMWLRKKKVNYMNINLLEIGR